EELVGLPGAIGQYRGEAVAEVGRGDVAGRQPYPDLPRLSTGDSQYIVQGSLGTAAIRVHRRGIVQHMVVDAVLRVPRPPGPAEEPLRVGFVVAEQRDRGAVTGERQRTEPVVLRGE